MSLILRMVSLLGVESSLSLLGVVSLLSLLGVVSSLSLAPGALLVVSRDDLVGSLLRGQSKLEQNVKSEV
jgi:hypothetical protein